MSVVSGESREGSRQIAGAKNSSKEYICMSTLYLVLELIWRFNSTFFNNDKDAKEMGIFNISVCLRCFRNRDDLSSVSLHIFNIYMRNFL